MVLRALKHNNNTWRVCSLIAHSQKTPLSQALEALEGVILEHPVLLTTAFILKRVLLFNFRKVFKIRCICNRLDMNGNGCRSVPTNTEKETMNLPLVLHVWWAALQCKV